MLLQTVRSNIVQSIRAYRVEDLMQAAQNAGQHFLYANLTAAQSKQEVLDTIAEIELHRQGMVGELDPASARGEALQIGQFAFDGVASERLLVKPADALGLRQVGKATRNA